MAETHPPPNAAEPSGGTTVLLVADPGLPTARARALEESLGRELDEVCAAPVHVEVRTSTLRLRPDGTLDVSHARQQARQVGDQDVVLLLTEIPRLHGGLPLIAEIVPERNVAVVSCPTLGVIGSRRRVLDALMACAVQMLPTRPSSDQARRVRRWVRWEETTGPEEHILLRGTRLVGGARTVVGMVAGNEPLRTAPKLSRALAAAFATGAFGIFYSSIWSMSMYLTTQRLVSIGILAMLLITVWLILSNRLWDEPENERLDRVVLLYNLSTVLTLLMIVLLLYLALVVGIFTAALIIIDPDYLAVTIEREASVVRYLDIAWLSAAMGVVAGALGSSFDEDADLRNLTHGQRERQRRFTEEEPGE